MEHGIGAVGSENGRLNICVHEEEGNIVIRVCDNGPGMSSGGGGTVLSRRARRPATACATYTAGCIYSSTISATCVLMRLPAEAPWCWRYRLMYSRNRKRLVK